MSRSVGRHVKRSPQENSHNMTVPGGKNKSGSTTIPSCFLDPAQVVSSILLFAVSNGLTIDVHGMWTVNGSIVHLKWCIVFGRGT